MNRVLVTGGAGFVGANVAIALRQHAEGREVIALDSLRRRGSELNLSRLREAGVHFVHGDVREPGDLLEAGAVDAIVECSADSSVLAGTEGGTEFVVGTNLLGAYHCFEFARRYGAQVVFLSTSRVYPVTALNALAHTEAETRYELHSEQPLPGASSKGVSEAFPLQGARTLYGATKLAAELLLAEYEDAFGVPAVVNRCGVVAGPWQMGKAEQGVFTHWVLAHLFGQPLVYLGYGGSGKQVRDLLYIDDLVELIEEQIGAPERWSGAVVNVGGGRPCSLSLRETTELCVELTGKRVPVAAGDRERVGDVRIYLSDCARLEAMTAWRPRHDARGILAAVVEWASANERPLRAAIGAT
jgi:CDP-paratose 2-epimerase